MSKPTYEKEVKFYLLDLPALEVRLRKQGAVLEQPRTFELNYRFDTPDHQLTRAYQVLRLRKDAKVRLTYKGPDQSTDEIRMRPEIEVEVDDFDTTRLLLESLGYSLVVIYEKWRTTYSLNGLEITLDELPYGNFSEIEGEDTDFMRRTASTLGLDWKSSIRDGYLALFEALRTRKKLKLHDLTFDSFKNLSVTAQDLGVTPADQPLFL